MRVVAILVLAVATSASAGHSRACRQWLFRRPMGPWTEQSMPPTGTAALDCSGAIESHPGQRLLRGQHRIAQQRRQRQLRLLVRAGRRSGISPLPGRACNVDGYRPGRLLRPGSGGTGSV